MIKDFLSKKALLKAAKAVFLVYCSYVKLFDLAKNKKKKSHQSEEVIIQTIDHIKDPLGFERAFRTFGLSCQHFYAWKRTLKNLPSKNVDLNCRCKGWNLGIFALQIVLNLFDSDVPYILKTTHIMNFKYFQAKPIYP